MTEEFLGDLFICSTFVDNDDMLAKADQLYYSAVNLHNETIDSIKGYRKIVEDKKEIKSYFTKLYNSFLENLDSIYEELSKIMSEKDAKK